MDAASRIEVHWRCTIPSGAFLFSLVLGLIAGLLRAYRVVDLDRKSVV